MSEDWRKYLVKSVCYAIAFFIANCVIFKLLIGQTNWLEMSIIWFICALQTVFSGMPYSYLTKISTYEPGLRAL